MSVLRVRYSYVIATGAVLQEFAQPFIPPQVTLDSVPVRYTVAIPVSSTVTLWDATAGGANPTDFAFLLLHSDIEVEIEQKAFVTAGSLTSYSTFTLAAGHIPFTLGSSKARAAAAFSGDALVNGTIGKITKLRAKNSSTDTIAYVEVVVGGA